MAARLYNHTRYPDALLREILNFSASCAGVSGDVPVKITASRNLKPGGMAHWSFPYRKTLAGKPGTSRDKRLLKCPVGWITVSLPRSAAGDFLAYNCFVAADWFVNICIHEMAHIRQYRQEYRGREYFSKAYNASRKTAHDRRPCEIDAHNTVDAVHQNRQKEARRRELVPRLGSVMLEAVWK